MPKGVLRPEGVALPDGVTRPDGVLRLSPPCSSGVKLCTITTGRETATGMGCDTVTGGDTITGGDTVTGVTERVLVVGVELDCEGGVTRAAAAGTYMGTDEIGFPMAGAGGGTGDGDLFGAAFTGLRGLGGTRGGGANLVWGLLTLMLMVVLALAAVAWTAVVV